MRLVCMVGGKVEPLPSECLEGASLSQSHFYSCKYVSRDEIGMHGGWKSGTSLIRMP